MSIQKVPGRQWPLYAVLAINFADVLGDSGVPVGAIDLPGGATVIGGSLNIQEAFNSGTTDVIDVTGAASVAGVDAQAVGVSPLVVNGLSTVAPVTLDVEWTGAGALPTAGKALLVVEYVINARATEVQPA